jgi:hypothetical protein
VYFNRAADDHHAAGTLTNKAGALFRRCPASNRIGGTQWVRLSLSGHGNLGWFSVLMREWGIHAFDLH